MTGLYMVTVAGRICRRNVGFAEALRILRDGFEKHGAESVTIERQR